MAGRVHGTRREDGEGGAGSAPPGCAPGTSPGVPGREDQGLRQARTSEAHYRAIFDYANDAIFIHDAQSGAILDVNRRTEEIFGRTREQLLRATVQDISAGRPPYSQADASAWIAKAAAGEPQVFEWQARRGDGELFWSEVSLRAMRVGGRDRVIAIVRDIDGRTRTEKALRESEAKFRGLVQSSSDWIWEVDAAGVYTFASSRVEVILGYTPEEVVGRRPFDFMPPEEARRVAAVFQDHSRRGEPIVGLENTNLHKDGRRVVLETSGVPVRDAAGTVVGYRGVDRDVTERIEAERALRKSERFLQDVFGAIQDGICVLDRELTIVRANAWMAAKYAHEMPLVGKKCYQAYQKRSSPCPSCPTTKALATGEVHRGELPYPDPEAPSGWFSLSAFPMKDERGDITGVIEYIEDVTESRRVQEALREARESLEAAVAQSPSGILIADAPNGRIRLANQAAFGIRGGPTDLLTGIDVARHAERWQTFRPDGQPYPPEELPLSRAVLRGEMTRSEEVIIRDEDGVDHWVSANAAPIRDADGQISAGIVVFHDITERKRAEAERVRLEAQLRQAQKMESVGRLAGGIAHDFNNMLSVILGHADFALREAQPWGGLHADLIQIRRAAERSADLIRQLLAFARKQTISPEVLDLNATVAGMLQMLRRLIGEDIDLAWHPGQGLWPVCVDPSQIDQILANLCVNARDAVGGVGRVTIETQNVQFDEACCDAHAGFEPGAYVLLAVSDNGRGMDDQTLGSIFEPFFTTKDVGEGTGLGLATVYGIVKQNGGFIHVYSEVGVGTTFKVYLPRHGGGVAQDAEPAARPGEAKPAVRGGETILLVEDEPAILNLGRKMLEKLGYRVLTAETPGEAIDKARQHAGEIHLLLTDVVMPEMNGRDLAKAIMSLYPDLKRLFMSGYTANVIAHHGVLAPGVHFIQKPFSQHDLASKVRQALHPQ